MGMQRIAKFPVELLRELDRPIQAGSDWRMEVADETHRPIFSLRVIAEYPE